MRRHNLGLIVFLVAIFWSATSFAVQVSIDSFSSMFFSTGSNSYVTFTDTFSDGPPPPCGPNGCASQPSFYGVNSTNPLPAESGGFLQLDSSNGLLGTNASGGARINETVQVGGTKSQLFQTDPVAYSIIGIFTLPSLSGPLNNGYGIRFIDADPGSGPGTNQQVLELNVQWWSGDATHPAGWYIRYLVQDFNANTIMTIGADLVNIPSGDNEICLSLDRADSTSNFFSAGYAYGTNGACSGAETSLGSAEGFQYQGFVRAQFHAFATVPEPGSWLLTALGLLGLGWVRRWKGKAWF